MNRILFVVVFSLIAVGIAWPVGLKAAEDGTKYTYVIVPGSTGGGWDWKNIDQLLTEDHHVVYRITLTGLGERVHLASPDINLTTHIEDVVNTILFEDLDNVVLVGHSYAGMVITGVMDRIPDRIGHVIYLDAVVPEDGMSCFDVLTEAGIALPPADIIRDGLVYFPWIDLEKPYPRDVPHPLKTLTEPVSYKNPKALELPGTFVAYVTPGQIKERQDNDKTWKRARKRGWDILTIDSDHNAQRSHPKKLVKLLETAPEF